MTDAQSYGPERNEPRFVPCASVSDAPWFCVHTKPQLEIATEHRIRVEGFSAWLPLTSVVQKNRQSRIVPVFSRYLFVQNYRWTVVRNAGGEEMASVLRSPSGKPLVVPQAKMDELFAQCKPNGVIYAPEPREITRKDMVRVEDGPFTSFTGICQRTTRDRVWILLSLFGRQSEVPFTRQQVELIA